MALAIVDWGTKYTVERDPAWKGGLYRATFRLDDIWQRVAGQRAAVDESLILDGQDGFARKIALARYGYRAAEDGTRRIYPRREVLTEYVQFGRPQFYAAGAWSNVVAAFGGWARGPSGWGGTWSGTNFSITASANWHRAKISVTFDTALAARRVRWPITLVGLHLDGWKLVSNSAGAVVGWIDRPFAVDSSGAGPEGGRHYPVTPSVGIVGSAGYVEFNANLAGAVYPVTIDPTLTLQTGAGDSTDSFIRSGFPDSNAGTDLNIQAGLYGAETWRGLLWFNISSIPAGSTINSAIASLWLYYNNLLENATTLAYYRLKRAWVETEVTWNIYSTGNSWQTAGGFGANDCEQTNIGTLALGASEAVGEKQVSLTAASIQEMIAGGAWTNNGFMLRHTESVNDYAAYRSSEYATDTERPKLVVDYTAGGGGLSIPVAMQLRRMQGVS